jgi:hypothetical protein
MSTTLKELLGTQATLLSTELNGLANNAQVVSSVLNSTGIFDNTEGTGSTSTTGDGYERGYLTLHLAALGGNPGANTTIDIWFLKSVDGGGTYEDGSSSITPQRPPDCQFQVDSGRSTAQTQTKLVFLPACKFYTMALNNALGEALASASNTLKLTPATDQLV